METITEFIERTEKEATVDIAKEKLSALLELLPGANADMLLHNLSLVSEDKRERLMSLVQSEGVVNNKAVMVSILGMLVSFKTVTDAIEAATVAENHIVDSTSGVTERLLGDFREQVADLIVFAIEELNKSKGEIAAESVFLRQALASFHQAMADAAQALEEGYKERKQHLTDHANKKTEEIDAAIAKAMSDVRKVFGELAAKELRTAILPVVLKAIGWRGFLSVVGAVTCGIFLHDFIVYVFLKVFH